MPEPMVTEPERTAAPPPSDKGQVRKTVRDLTWSMGLVAVVIAVVMVIFYRPQPDPVREVDALPVAQAVAAAVRYPVLYPKVGADWRATSARYEPTEKSHEQPVWFTGWVTPNEQFAAVIQAATDAPDFVKEQTLDGVAPRSGGPEQPVGPWTAYVSADGATRSLVRTAHGVTTIVSATMPWPQVIAFRDALVPVRAR